MCLKPADYVGGFFEGCAKVLDFARIVKYEENASEKRAGGHWKWGLRIRRENSFLLLPPLPSFVLCPPRQLVVISFLFKVRPLFANHRWQRSRLRNFGALRFNSKNIKRKNCCLPCYIMFSVNYHLIQSLAI